MDWMVTRSIRVVLDIVLFASPLMRQPADSGTVNANYTTIQGFDIGGGQRHPATLAHLPFSCMPRTVQQLHRLIQLRSRRGTLRWQWIGNGAHRGHGRALITDSCNDRTHSAGTKIYRQFPNNMGDITNVNCNQTHGLYIEPAPTLWYRTISSGMLRFGHQNLRQQLPKRGSRTT